MQSLFASRFSSVLDQETTMVIKEDTSAQHHVPTKEELDDAILQILNENDSPLQSSTKNVQKKLADQNPTWKLPERRVAKFLKRQKKDHVANKRKDSSPRSEDEASASSNASRTRKLLQNTGAAIKSTTKSVKGVLNPKSAKAFTFRSKKKGDSDTETPPPESAPQEPLASKEIVEETSESQPATTKAANGGESTDAATRGLENIYEDDNDGENKTDCFCAGCVIV